jgi:putative aldouronate transport system substrate-binding protein
MKIKKLAVFGAVAAVAGLSLASCGGETKTTEKSYKPVYTEDADLDITTNGEVNVYINYKGQAGVTLRDANGYYNKVEQKNYAKGDLLPVWEQLQKKVGVTIKEATEYGKSSDNDVYKQVDPAGYKSEVDSSKMIDLFYNATSNIEKMGAANKAVDLLQYVNDGTMPNFKKFLESNPTMKKALTKGGKIYYTPYFDGYNNIERMFVVDTDLVKKVLDNDDQTKDTAKNQGNSATGVAKVEFQPFMDDNNNYAADTKVKVSKDAALQEITIKKTTNIIKQQNASMTAGASGADLRKQLKDYLQAAFGEYVGEGKLYKNYSDIYISESAAYNTDELIALMRVIKASAELISGDANNEIEIICPRGQDRTRVQNVMMIMKIFGIQGMDGETDMLYYDQDGNLNDAASTAATYEGLKYLSQLYDEGLILGEFYKSAASNSGTAYTAKYFGKTAANPGYGFMLYDFCATQAQNNTIDEDKVGTADSKRQGTFKDTSVTGIMPILSPLTYWATEKGTNAKTDQLKNRTHKTLIRYEESNRALKTTSWCIPTTATNKVGAAKLMDYLVGQNGAIINDFGPKQYWKDPSGATFTYLNEKTPEFNDTFKGMISESGKDFWTFARNYLGATHGIGYTRTATINYLATNKYGKIGQLNMDNSIESGATNLCLVDKYGATATFDTSVPSSGYEAVTDAVAKTYDAVTSFWSADKLASDANGWVKAVVSPVADITNNLACGKTNTTNVNYTYGDVQNQIAARITGYLFTMANSFDAVPAYIQ